MARKKNTPSEALYRLLHDANYRKAFVEGRHKALDLSNEDLVDFSTIDIEELEKASERVLLDITRGNYDLDGGLKKSFPGVFASIGIANLDEKTLLRRFLASTIFGEYREVPFFGRGRGIAIEEAFYLFLRSDSEFVQAASANELLLLHEYLTVMLSILTVNRTPHFKVKTRNKIRFNGHCWYAVATYPRQIIQRLLGESHHLLGEEQVRYLYAASAKGTYVSGPIDSFAEQAISLGSGAVVDRHVKKLSDQFGMTREGIKSAVRKLEHLGLIAAT